MMHFAKPNSPFSRYSSRACAKRYIYILHTHIRRIILYRNLKIYTYIYFFSRLCKRGYPEISFEQKFRRVTSCPRINVLNAPRTLRFTTNPAGAPAARHRSSSAARTFYSRSPANPIPRLISYARTGTRERGTARSARMEESDLPGARGGAGGGESQEKSFRTPALLECQ